MAGRFVVVMFSFLAAVVGSGGIARAELRPCPERPDVVEVDDPVLIGGNVLDREMRLNGNLASHIELFGRPDYAEIQEVTVQEPFASYEVRIYYLRRNSYQAYGRVAVAPSVYDYGVRKFEGPIRPETLDRLLTATVEPLEEVEEAAVLDVEEQAAAVVIVENEAPTEMVEAEVVEARVVAADGEVVEAQVVEAVEPAEPVQVAAASEGSGRTLEEIISRLEAAADRAAVAATMAEEAAISATRSADRATSVLERVAREAGE